MNQRGFVPVIFILIIAVVFAGIIGRAYYFLEKPKVSEQKSISPKVTPVPTKEDETANWKTYTNTEYKFSLKYPTNFNTSCRADSYDCSFDTFVGPGRGPENFIWLSIVPSDPQRRIYDVYNGKGIDTLLRLNKNESKEISNEGTNVAKYFTYKRLEDIPIDGIPGKVFENQQPWEFSQGTIERRVYLMHNNYIYVIGAYTQSADISLDLFNQILSTFKFLNKDISTERIVIKDDHWFEFNVPKGYRLDRNKVGSYLGYIVDEQGNKLIGFGFNSAGGELSPMGKTIIDGIPFTIDYNNEVSCSVDIYPSKLKFSLDSLYFFIYTWCKPEEDNKISNKSFYKEVIGSLKFSPQLKEVLSGDLVPPLLEDIP